MLYLKKNLINERIRPSDSENVIKTIVKRERIYCKLWILIENEMLLSLYTLHNKLKIELTHKNYSMYRMNGKPKSNSHIKKYFVCI